MFQHPQPAVLPVKEAAVDLHLLLRVGERVPLLRVPPAGPPRQPRSLGWAGGCGLDGGCASQIWSACDPSRGWGVTGPSLVEGDQGSELGMTSLLPPTLLEEHRSLPNPQPLERTELARGAHRARHTVNVAGGRVCPPPHALELSCAQISLGAGNTLEDVVMLDAGPVALVPQGGGVCEAGRFRRALPLTGRDVNCRGPWQAGWSCC